MVKKGNGAACSLHLPIEMETGAVPEGLRRSLTVTPEEVCPV